MSGILSSWYGTTNGIHKLIQVAASNQQPFLEGMHQFQTCSWAILHAFGHYCILAGSFPCGN